MSQNPEQEYPFRAYLLGTLNSERQQAIEERLLADPDLLEHLQVSEDELIDEYLAGELAGEMKVRFESYFLATPERKRAVQVAQALRQYVDAASDVTSNVVRMEPRPRPNPSMARLLAIAAAVIIVAASVLGVWRWLSGTSELEKGTAALHVAFARQRPIESRIVGFDHAPFIVTRGASTSGLDELQLERAQRILTDLARDNPSAAVHHALGQVYLSKRQYAEAIEQFEAALKLDDGEARAHADLGAALLEKARLDRLRDVPEDAVHDALARALVQLDRAIALNASLLEARFNRALCYEELRQPVQARAAWQQYLQQDASSPWADDARQHLRQ